MLCFPKRLLYLISNCANAGKFVDFAIACTAFSVRRQFCINRWESRLNGHRLPANAAKSILLSDKSRYVRCGSCWGNAVQTLGSLLCSFDCSEGSNETTSTSVATLLRKARPHRQSRCNTGLNRPSWNYLKIRPTSSLRHVPGCYS